MVVSLFEDETFETREDIELLKKLFKLSAQERREAGVVKHKFAL